MNGLRSVVLITADLVLRNRLERVLSNSFRIVLFSNIQSSLDYIYSSMPDLMVVESMGANDSWTKGILNDLKNDPIFGQIPIMVITEDDMVSPNWHSLIADDYVRRSSLEAEAGGPCRIVPSALRSLCGDQSSDEASR